MIRLVISSLLVLAATSTARPKAPVQTAFRRSPYVGAISACEEIRKVHLPDGRVETRKDWRIICDDASDRPAYPASVSKLMTLLLVMEDVRRGKYDFESEVVATADVGRCEPSWVGLKAGEKMTVRDLCLALMVESANDAAIALGVNASGSFDAFVARMNARAAELGMRNTRYYNPNGLPPNPAKRYPWKSFNVSTAADQLRLAKVLVEMPETFEFTSVKTCDLIKVVGGFRVAVTRRAGEAERKSRLAEGEKLVKQMLNHNNILRQDKLRLFDSNGREAVDGLKTGYIDSGGSSIVLSARNGECRALVVVMGSSSSSERDDNAWRLMTDALSVIKW